MAAGLRKSERVVRERSGTAHYDADTHTYALLLDFIPVSLKNRGRTMLNRKSGAIIHYRDKSVQRDIDAIRKVWRTVEPRPPICGLRMEMTVTVCRPLGPKEMDEGVWSLRRGDDINIVGLVMDALGAEPKKGVPGCCYNDDRQVTKLVIEENRNCAVPSVAIEVRPR